MDFVGFRYFRRLLENEEIATKFFKAQTRIEQAWKRYISLEKESTIWKHVSKSSIVASKFLKHHCSLFSRFQSHFLVTLKISKCRHLLST